MADRAIGPRGKRGAILPVGFPTNRTIQPIMTTKVRMLQPAVRVLDAHTVKVAPKTADRELLTPEHKAWRAAVMRRAGYRCEVFESGRRCERSAPRHRLFADHIVERRDGGAALDPANGQCLCGKHHTLKTMAARAKRLADTILR